MISEQNLEKIYDDILSDHGLTTKLLNSHGFNSSDLKKLVETNELIRIKRGYYILGNVSKMFYYGMKLIKNKDYGLAEKCFEKCYQISPNNPSVCFQMFIIAIKQKNMKNQM